MDDDFNTARAIGFMFDSVRQANRVLDNMGKSDSFQDTEMLYSLYADLMRAGKILGLGTETPSEFFEQKKARSLGDEGVDETLIEKLVAERLQARKEKDWAKADQVR
ncbi:MAG: cysteine--tRNA ligase, partial [Deltaproteobacteria bacterium]|nr:cysteine--tRNA ligase [Deltaproteobacteria bacterium]